MSNQVLKTETETTFISYDPLEGFVRVSSKEEVDLELRHAIADMEASEKLLGGKMLPVVSDTRGIRSDTPEVRNYYSSPEGSKYIRAMGIVIDSLAMRMIGNFFIRVNKPPYPCKLFNKMEEAERWIMQYVETASPEAVLQN